MDTYDVNSSINMRVQSSITQPLYLKTTIREFSYRRADTYTMTKATGDLDLIKLASGNISQTGGDLHSTILMLYEILAVLLDHALRFASSHMFSYAGYL